MSLFAVGNYHWCEVFFQGLDISLLSSFCKLFPGQLELGLSFWHEAKGAYQLLLLHHQILSGIMRSSIFWFFTFIEILIGYYFPIQENQVINEVHFVMFNFFQSMLLFDDHLFNQNLINRLGI